MYKVCHMDSKDYHFPTDSAVDSTWLNKKHKKII